ncbi:MAG TPA: hypothetical protein ENI38_01535 [Candidatus Acetothermia bacterium]|nr:hypothetical protein [Candidatus Acetothermia bacterium]
MRGRAFKVALLGGSFLALALYALLRAPPSPVWVEVVGPERVLQLSLAELKRWPTLEREGSYQNRFGNWQGRARYRGVLLSELVRAAVGEAGFEEVVVIGADGYRASFTPARIEDLEYPVVLAFSRNGQEPPAWEDGPQIAVLPEDGGVSNAEYEAESAGAFWVKQVVRIEIVSQGARTPPQEGGSG